MCVYLPKTLHVEQVERNTVPGTNSPAMITGSGSLEPFDSVLLHLVVVSHGSWYSNNI